MALLRGWNSPLGQPSLSIIPNIKAGQNQKGATLEYPGTESSLCALGDKFGVQAQAALVSSGTFSNGGPPNKADDRPPSGHLL